MLEVDILWGIYWRRSEIHIFVISYANLDQGSQIRVWETWCGKKADGKCALLWQILKGAHRRQLYWWAYSKHGYFEDHGETGDTWNETPFSEPSRFRQWWRSETTYCKKKKEEEITKIKRFCRVIDFSVYKMLQTVKYNRSVEGFDYLISSSILG